jgi:hypothetical protein
VNPPLDNLFAPPEADIGPPRPALDRSDVDPEEAAGPMDGAVSRLIFRWEGYRFFFDAVAGVVLAWLWHFDEPRFWHFPAKILLPVTAIVLNVAFTFGPMLACADGPGRWIGPKTPAVLAAVGSAIAIAAVAWELWFL